MFKLKSHMRQKVERSLSILSREYTLIRYATVLAESLQ